MSQDMKITVQLFIQTNRSFIEQKTYNTFRLQCVKDKELSELDARKMVSLLKDMFSFQGNPDMNIFFELAPENIQKYISEQYKVTSELDDLVIDIQKLMNIVLYCVEHGFTQRKKQQIKEQVKEEVKQEIKEQIKEQNKQQNPQKQEKQIQPIRKRILRKESEEEPPKQKPKKIYIPKPKTPEKKNFIQKHSMPEKVMGPRYLSHMNSQNKVKKQEQQTPLVAPINLSFIEKNRKMIDTRLQHLFRHYCTQQLNIGQTSTFDRIKDECSKMTLGKFLLFCKTTGVFSDKEISKNYLTSKYKKLSEGLKEIGFEKFKELMEQIDEEYIKQKKMKTSEQIGSYEARLMLQNLSFKKMKKTVDLPFTTRQQNGRQLKQYSTISHNRYEEKKKQLTNHSGRFSKDLKEDIDIKEQLLKQRKKRKSEPLTHSKIIKLQNIGEYKMGMDWIIEEDETDQYFMKQYKLRDVVGNLKKRVGEFEKMEKKKLF